MWYSNNSNVEIYQIGFIKEVKRDYEELKKLDTGFFKRIKNWLSFKNRLDDIYTERNHQIQEIRDIYQVKYDQFDASIF